MPALNNPLLRASAATASTGPTSTPPSITRVPSAAPQDNAAATSTPAMSPARKAYETIKSKVNYLGRQIDEIAHRLLPKAAADFLITAIKIKPIALLAFLLIPSWVALTTFCIATAVVIISPAIAKQYPNLFSFASKTMGIYSVLHAVKEAMKYGFAQIPHLHLMATAIHMAVCFICFKFANEHAVEDDGQDEVVKAMKDLGLAKAKAAIERARQEEVAEKKAKAAAAAAPSIAAPVVAPPAPTAPAPTAPVAAPRAPSAPAPAAPAKQEAKEAPTTPPMAVSPTPNDAALNTDDAASDASHPSLHSSTDGFEHVDAANAQAATYTS